MDDWLSLYCQLDQANRRAVYRLIWARLWRSRLRRLTGRLPQPAPTPLPVRLPFIHALLSFTVLGLLPARPLAIPTALGLSLAILIYAQLFRRMTSSPPSS
jgi:hypothetical protein